MNISELETPCLLLDKTRLERNINRMAKRCEALGVTLRPHLKTPKSIDVAQLAAPDTGAPITVSTLKEAEYFADAGYRDILYAATPTALKLARTERIRRATGAAILLVADSTEFVTTATRVAQEIGTQFSFLIEIDSGEHRSGVRPASDTLLAIAEALAEAPGLNLAGIMTHGGHSYAHADPSDIVRIAEAERDAVVSSALMLREAGHECRIVSAGSSPTLLHAPHLKGVSEARAGVYLFWDLDQYSRGICEEDDIAVGVLSTVIGHNRAGERIIIDAGSLALSKDLGANAYMPEVKYGLLCDPLTRQRHDGLSVATAYQEHGVVPVPDESWYDSPSARR